MLMTFACAFLVACPRGRAPIPDSVAGREAENRVLQERSKLVRGTCAGILIEFANKTGENRADQRERAKQPETIEKTKDCRLALQFGVELGCSVDRGVYRRKAMMHQVGTGRGGIIAQSILPIGNVGYQHVLVILATPRKHGGDEGDAEAAALIAK